MSELSRGARSIAIAFTASGVTHLVRPQVFEPIVPRFLGNPRTLVHLSGVAELTCAAALVVPRTRAVGAVASAALLAAVFPANVKMAADAASAARRRPSPTRNALAAATIVRLPLQWPMIRWVWSERH